MIAKHLEFGDTIGIIAPASPEKEEETVKKSIDFIKSLNFNVKIGKHIYDRYGYLAGKDKDRAEDLMDMFLDPEVKMVLCCRGGYGTMRMLNYVDFDEIKKHPKIFAGFSDITTLLNQIYQRCGIVTFHSPMATSNLKDEPTLKSFLFSIMSGTSSYTIKNPEGYPVKCPVKGTAEGTLVGGNLSLIAATMGTKYEIDTENKILFLEDVGEEPYSIDRMLTQLELAGKLQKCQGFILGQYKNCTLPHYERSLTLDQIFEEKILSLKKPTLKDFSSGHSYPKLTLPIGAKVKLNCSKGEIDVLQAVVK